SIVVLRTMFRLVSDLSTLRVLFPIPCLSSARVLLVFFFSLPSATEIYTLSLHDALPISETKRRGEFDPWLEIDAGALAQNVRVVDRKSTRLNSSHQIISYAVFCLKKKNKT